MKVTVDRGLCDGNGVCMGIAPDVYDIDDDLTLHIVHEIPDDPAIRAQVRQSITACPVLALSLKE
ncbi:ferredoxin [Streptomyces albipurpureus]|uniref:Ferredoxin n=1 Tax=Streptomyces albipurpureus TaxID=2897419 RepID=A0ABT0UI93_9ACTN|nr:ferredoxin [Streptomyces sp. CWNU-1]MCM2388155.1 ferredoxin [Streptomyces sp. CWNU-1]